MKGIVICAIMTSSWNLYLLGPLLAILAEELAEIHSTPTPKGWSEPKKVIDLYLIDWLFFTIARV